MIKLISSYGFIKSKRMVAPESGCDWCPDKPVCVGHGHEVGEPEWIEEASVNSTGYHLLGEPIDLKTQVTVHNVDTVYYHGGCADGFIAAWLVWRDARDGTKFIPCQRSHIPKPADYTDKCVLILDLMFPPGIMSDIRAMAEGLLVIDHHVGSEADLLATGIEHKVDTNHCAAVLTHKWTGTCYQPPFLNLIEIHDLHKGNPTELQEAAEFVAGLIAETEWNFKCVPSFNYDDEIYSLQRIGKHILAERRRAADMAVKYAALSLVRFRSDGPIPPGELLFVATTNVSGYTSEVSQALFEKYPWLDIVVMYYGDTINEVTQFSLRSQKYDLVPLVRSIEPNAGGHQQAAALRLPGAHLRLPLEQVATKEIGLLAKGVQTRLNKLSSDAQQKCRTVFTNIVD